jgi:short-subunit dehydrogenase
MSNIFQGKVVVITGASSGVGRATAQTFARHGATLILAARREQALAEAVKECEELGGKAMYVPTDVTNIQDMQALASSAHSFGGRIDVWVNNAGVLNVGPFTDTPAAVHDRVIETNLLGYIHGAYAALPYFKRQQQGILINNISVGTWTPTPYAVSYTASKFGLRGFSQSLRGELSGYPNIHVCDVFPGFLDTPGVQHAGNYTGVALKPAPPVYDPLRVARAIVSLVIVPRNELMVGSAALFLRIAHFLFPNLTSAIAAGVMKTYFRKAPLIPVTSGNLFEPVEYGTSIYGGWRPPETPQRKAIKRGLLVAGIMIGLVLIGRRK